MANKVTMEFKKGDRETHYFKLPIADYSAGGTLFFAAKEVPDDDVTDAQAVINKPFTDSVVVLDAVWATWTLVFNAGDITNVSFADGSSQKTYEGEFQFVTSGGVPRSFPDNDDYIEVIIYADIKRAVA